VLVLVWVAAMLDKATGAAYIRTAVVLFYIANEALSVLENTAAMGVPYPKFIKTMLEALKEKADEGK
jgi:toxin secretion/phage lysis holin